MPTRAFLKPQLFHWSRSWLSDSGSQLWLSLRREDRRRGGDSALRSALHIFASNTQVALMFLVRHDAYHSATWTAWLDSVDGLMPVAAAHEACCRGRTLRHLRLQPPVVRVFDLITAEGGGPQTPQAGLATIHSQC